MTNISVILVSGGTADTTAELVHTDGSRICSLPDRIFSKSIKLMLERQKFPPYQQEMLLLRKKIKLYQQDMLLGRQKSTLYQHAAGEAIHSTSMLLERQKPTLYQQDMLEERAKITP